MVIYDLLCSSHHQFEGWFRSGEDYLGQKEQGLLSCPICDSIDIKKIPTASYISTGKPRQKTEEKQEPKDIKASIHQEVIPKALYDKFRQYLEKHTEDVGTQFAEEAKKIHYGEAERRNIRGQATIEEVVELREEGIEAVTLPKEVLTSKKLN